MIRGKEKFLSQLYMFTDFGVVQLAFLVSWYVRFEMLAVNGGQLPFTTYLLWSLVYGLIIAFLGGMFSLYTAKRKKKFTYEIYKVSQVFIFSLLILLSFLFLFKTIDLSRLFLGLLLGFSIFFVIIYRFIIKLNLKSLRKKGFNKQFTLIVGAGALAERYFNSILEHPEYGVKVVGFLDDKEADQINGSIRDLLIGKTNELEEVLDSEVIDEVVIALPLESRERYQEMISVCEQLGVRATIIPDFYDVFPATPSFDSLDDIPIINVRYIPLDEWGNKILKRAFDILFSILAILFTLPIMLLIALSIKMTSKGPIIFKQERMGLNRRTFFMYKFRTMNEEPDKPSDTTWTIRNDPRRTKLGVFLRFTSLDELPQFFNVLKGEMSVVGPRPERPYFVNQFKNEVSRYMVKHHVRPGITGWAQVCGYRGDTSISSRIIHDLFYIENWTILLDLKIVIKTIKNGLINKNAY